MRKAVIIVNPYLKEEYESYQPRRIREELEARGVSVRILPNIAAARISSGTIEEELTGRYDFAVYLDKDKYLPRMLEQRGMRLFNRAEAVELCDDKMLTHIALSGLPAPTTISAPLCYKPNERAKSLKAEAEKLGYPVVVKECFGSLGAQVYLARNEEELDTLCETLKLKPFLLQEFVKESAGVDLRAICVGGEVVACMKRTAVGDFRSNIAQGGRGEPFAPTGEVRALSKTVSTRLGLDYCGIDFLFGRNGLLLCEVNSNAFFGGVERTTGCNVGGAYADHIIRAVYGT